ncbi:MAG: response regulator [Lachnospiraceae bacterium]|nr:response regulator [Lachnospiraceae bacterium]
MFANYTIPPKTYYEIASFGYLLVLLLLSFRDKKRGSYRSYKYFRYLQFNMLLALLVSVATYTFAYPELGTPLYICTILRTLDSVMSVMASRTFAVYLMEYVDSERRMRLFLLVGNVILGAYLVLMVLNINMKFILWYMPDGTYLHGALFVPVVFAAPVYYLTLGLLMLILRFNTLGNRERVSLSIASFLTLFGIIVQAATNGRVLLSLPFGSIGVFVLYFSIETADYHQLLQKNEDLKIAEQDATKANRAKSDFLASMSHEIRTPLNAVLGMDELILMETEKRMESDPEFSGLIKEYAENIRDAGQVLLSVINDILDITKIESGKMEIKPVEYNLGDIINDVGTIVGVRAEQKGLTYIENTDHAIPNYLVGDELRIRQIMINLLNNAIKYTDKGRVVMLISMKDRKEDDLTLCIRVQDTGIGIKEEDMPFIFGDFQRIDEDHNRGIEGTGLGLAIVKRLVVLMGGNIEVASRYGKGSVFTAYIPQKLSRGTDGKGSQKGKRGRLSEAITFHTPDCHYLLVDDNKMNLVVAKRFLDGLNGRIDMARSGEEALEKMRTARYDLIFMDHMMPQMDGIETYEISLDDPDNLNKETPVIMMTANALSGVREEYLGKGFSDYISKPLDIKELLRVTKAHLPAEKIVE